MCQFFCMDIFYNETKAMTDVDGLIERLLAYRPYRTAEDGTMWPTLGNPCAEAAAALAELKAQLAEARAALEPFAHNIEYVDWLELDDGNYSERPPFKAGDYRRAATAIRALPERTVT